MFNFVVKIIYQLEMVYLKKMQAVGEIMFLF
jgi:hypothetical protein